MFLSDEATIFITFMNFRMKSFQLIEVFEKLSHQQVFRFHQNLDEPKIPTSFVSLRYSNSVFNITTSWTKYRKVPTSSVQLLASHCIGLLPIFFLLRNAGRPKMPKVVLSFFSTLSNPWFALPTGLITSIKIPSNSSLLGRSFSIKHGILDGKLQTYLSRHAELNKILDYCYNFSKSTFKLLSIYCLIFSAKFFK